MYQSVKPGVNFVEEEKKIKQFWDDNNIFEKSIDSRAKGEPYVFYDGPPTANGKPHIGHVLTRVIKDLIPRYHTMKGEMVPRKAGWDTHGLPVELEVEKLLGLDGKEQIEKYGLEPFINHCKESVWKYKGMWEDFSKTVGFWADMDNPYVTYDNNFIESEWWALKQIFEKGLLYKGFKIVPYCPRCGTPLSSHEVAQGYKLVKERSAVVRFKAKGEDAYFLAWTTTPWTLPSNTALCVNPNDEYCKVKAADGYTYYMAKALLDAVLGKLATEETAAYEILESYTGKKLEYKEYEPLFECAGKTAASQNKKAFFVMCDDYVTMSDGTGIVHCAPAFGEDDARVGRKYDLPFLQFVDGKGNMTEDTPYAGKFVKDADPKILVDLDKSGALYDAPKFEHDYPFCWRCDTPLIYYAQESWFINMTAVKDDLIKNNDTINWIPETIGKKRFGDWLRNVQDWGISRNRYWGTPLNIWICECGHMHSIGSIEELKQMSDNCPDNIELHRPYIDEVTIKCPVCGKQMHRVPEVIDCWFDSGSMPFAQHHYPFENSELFHSQFPADFISEAVDQTRGWFYSLLAISTLIFNKAPFKNVIVLGHVQDENGQKMSKSKGNAVDPFDALTKYGADAIRWYFYVNSAPWLPNRFYGKAVVEGQRKLMGTLWNTYAFYVLYANIDKFNPHEHTLKQENMTVMDKWLLSKLNSMIKMVDDYLAAYKIPEAAKELQEFVDDLSNWYVRRCRERYWATEMTDDKITAYLVLYEALVKTVKVAAPFIPFITENIYLNIVRGIDKTAPESVHLCLYPQVEEKYIDTDLETMMDTVLQIVVLGRSARNGANIKNRQPINAMYVKCGVSLDDLFIDVIKDELNVKTVSFIQSFDDLVSYNFKPQLKTLGPKYGKLLGEIRTALSEIDANAAKAELDSTGVLKLALQSEEIVLSEEDLLIETTQKEGTFTVSDKGITVAIDTFLTEELIEEGFTREIVSKIQTMRKEAGYEVMNHISVNIEGDDYICSIVSKKANDIASDTLADSITCNKAIPDAFTKEWDINGEKVTVYIKKID